MLVLPIIDFQSLDFVFGITPFKFFVYGIERLGYVASETINVLSKKTYSGNLAVKIDRKKKLLIP
jgi:hypothetical protein